MIDIERFVNDIAEISEVNSKQIDSMGLIDKFEESIGKIDHDKCGDMCELLFTLLYFIVMTKIKDTNDRVKNGGTIHPGHNLVFDILRSLLDSVLSGKPVSSFTRIFVNQIATRIVQSELLKDDFMDFKFNMEFKEDV